MKQNILLNQFMRHSSPNGLPDDAVVAKYNRRPDSPGGAIAENTQKARNRVSSAGRAFCAWDYPDEIGRALAEWLSRH